MYTDTGTHMHMYVLMSAGREINKIPFAFHLIEPFQKAKHCKCRVRFWCVHTCHTVLHSRRLWVDKLLQQAYTHLLLLSSILSCGVDRKVSGSTVTFRGCNWWTGRAASEGVNSQLLAVSISLQSVPSIPTYYSTLLDGEF